MLPEALVIFACVKSAGCSETSSHYFNTNPEIREMVRMNEKRIERILGPTLIQVYGPVLYVAAGGTGTVRLSRHFSLQLNRDKGTLSYRVEW